MKDYVYLGSAPVEEDTIQVGDEDYATKARAEIKRYIDLIRSVCGKEEGTAQLGIKGERHDFGTYYEAVCSFDDNDPIGTQYAFYVESNCPMTWDDTSARPFKYDGESEENEESKPMMVRYPIGTRVQITNKSLNNILAANKNRSNGVDISDGYLNKCIDLFKHDVKGTVKSTVPPGYDVIVRFDDGQHFHMRSHFIEPVVEKDINNNEQVNKMEHVDTKILLKKMLETGINAESLESASKFLSEALKTKSKKLLNSKKKDKKDSEENYECEEISDKVKDVDDMEDLDESANIDKSPSAGLTKKERSEVVKKAKKGKDLGSKGKDFEKVAKKAGEFYGSEEIGRKVAAASMWKKEAAKKRGK